MSSRRLTGQLLALAAVPLLVLTVFFVVPVGAMVAQGFWVDGRFTPGAVLDVISRPRVLRVLSFTLTSAAAGTVLSVAVGMPAAYVLHRLAFPGRRALRALLLVPFVLPSVVVGVAFRELLADGGPLGFLDLDGSPVAIVAALVFFNAAVVVRAVGAAWESLDPRPAEAAAALGATPVQVWRTVTWPALRPAVLASASVVFLFCATAFGIVLVLGGLRYSTIETEIYLLTTNLLDLSGAAALSILQVLVVTLLLLVTARGAGATGPEVSRLPSRPRPIRSTDLPALAVTGALLVLVLAPLLTLVLGSLRVEGAWSFAAYTALQTPGIDQALLVPVTDALAISLATATDATWIALGLGIPIAIVVTRRSHTRAERRLRSVVDGLFLLPLGVSAVTLGFGLLITLDTPPFDWRDSRLLVPLAQALVALPLVVRLLTPVLAGIDDRQRQAAASLGAPPWRAWFTVELPVIWKPLLAAAGFAFAISLGEFGATSFLARDERPTLPVVIFRLLGHPGALNYSMALAAAVVLGLATTLVMVAVERFRPPATGGW